MKSRVYYGQIIPLLAIAVYKEPVFSASAGGLDLFYCCLLVYVQVQRYSVVYLTFGSPWIPCRRGLSNLKVPDPGR